jgi:hypothetical protein
MGMIDDEEATVIHQILGVFGRRLSEGDDLSEAWEGFTNFYGMSPDESDWLSEIIIDCALDGLDELTIAEATEPFLLSKIWEFLRGCAEEAKDPFGNEDAFSAKDVKVFDRKTNRYGHSYNADDEREASRPTKGPLQNARLNVAAESRQLPSVPLQEGLTDNRHMGAYVAAIKKSNNTYGGRLMDADYSTNNVADWKKAQLLREQQRARFGEDNELSEQNALNNKSTKNLKK